MVGLRRRVRAWATVWLVCQLAAVSAFVPRDCCAHHRKAAAFSKSHQGGDGAARHSHHGGHGAMHYPAPATDQNPRCVMRGTCNGALDAIATLFMAPGLPLQPFTLLDDGAPRPGVFQADANALNTLRLPTTPPPRV